MKFLCSAGRRFFVPAELWASVVPSGGQEARLLPDFRSGNRRRNDRSVRPARGLEGNLPGERSEAHREGACRARRHPPRRGTSNLKATRAPAFRRVYGGRNIGIRQFQRPRRFSRSISASSAAMRASRSARTAATPAASKRCGMCWGQFASQAETVKRMTCSGRAL